MKKILIGVLSFVITLTVILAAMAQTLPSDYSISATNVIETTPDTVYSKIVHLREWEKWSPWKQSDPSMTFQYSQNENATVRGDWVAWDSKKYGPGKMKITDVDTDNLLVYDLEIPGMTGATGAITLTNSNQKTVLTWSMKGNRSFVDKIFWRYFGVESKITTQLENGLTNLKQISEKK